MRVSDACSCGARFEARGLPSNVTHLWAAWINAHASCRSDERVVEVETA
jgi:hypothetical protein